MRCWGVIIVTGVLATACWAQEGELETVRQGIQETYGRRAADVARTDSEQDDIRLARELLRASGDSRRPALERFALADQAAVIALTPGMPKSMEVAREAVIVAHAIQAYPAPQREKRLLDIAIARMDRLESEGADDHAKAPAALLAVESYFVYTRAAASAGEVQSAKDALAAARRLVNQHDLDDFDDRLDEIEDLIGAAERRWQRLNQARQALADAEADADTDAVNRAKVDLAEVIMELDGDVLAAATYLVGTGDPREAAATAATALAAGDNVPAGDLMAAVVVLTEWVGALPETPRRIAAETVLGMCDAAGEADAEIAAAGQTAAFRERLAQLAGQTPGDALMQQLARAYGFMTGELTMLDDTRVRVVYSFGSGRQLSDWRVEQGQWDWARGALICRSGDGRREDAAIALRHFYRADRPLRLSFRVIASYQLGVALEYRPWGRGRQQGYSALFGAGGQQGLIQGTRFSVFGRHWDDRTIRLTAGQAVQMDITLDGAGGASWAIDGRTIYAYRPEQFQAGRVAGSIEIRLLTAHAGERTRSGFDDIVIEGEVLPEPNWRPTQ